MAGKNWKEKLSLSAFADEEQAEFLRARRRGFSRPLIFVVVIIASIFFLSLFFRVEDIRVPSTSRRETTSSSSTALPPSAGSFPSCRISKRSR